ncbi:hypothetical protein DK389_24995 [Methylobacterium durans]|uniref:Uncharacterized protein n=2 Tax=Methylobacterium durans TaxID=2202825 RepID=A0A2U8WEZ5_9HYPH|nr:hypothetical protein DK389_24995 [Methylobacterium durans]
MRLKFDLHDKWIVDPHELAAKLGTDATELRRLDELGLVVCRVVSGIGADEGKSRVTVRTEQAGWEGVFDLTGALIDESRLPDTTRLNGFTH